MFYLKGSSTHENSGIWAMMIQTLAYGWNAFMSTAVLAHQKNLKLHALFYDRDVSCQPQEKAWEKRAGDKAVKAAGEKLALCRDRTGSSEAWKAVKHLSCNKQTRETLIWMKKPGFLTEPVSAGVKEALRVMSKRQKQITEGSWQGCN